jgi:two-component system response regulator AtoC
MAYSILVVDDEALTLRTIGRALQAEGYEVFVAMSGEEALEINNNERPDLALVDVVLPGIDGIEVLRNIRRQNPSQIVLMMSAYHMVDRAVEAMKLGAYDYLVKPFHIQDMLNTMHRAAEMLALRVRVRESVQTEKGRYDFGRVVTENPAMRDMLETARKASESDRTTILIQGESGTGKEVLAKAIHYHSPRAAMPLLGLDCAALPETLLESEMFGYEQGAFTDARRRKEGLLEKANGGTLFLDEIGNMSHNVQAKLLRVLEESSFMRLGGTRPVQVDVRIVAATNKLLREAVAKNEFREDLFYRLNVVPLFIPPLRERREDVVGLAITLVQQFNRELKKNFTGFTPDAADALRVYPWPGNIRELKNVIERTMILAPEGEIDLLHLPEEVRDYEAEISEPIPIAEVPPVARNLPQLKDVELRYIRQVLTATGNNKAQAARILGIHVTSLLRRLKKEDQEEKTKESAFANSFE